MKPTGGAPVAVTACSSDDDASSTTAVVVAGAPLSINGPVIVAATDGDVIVGTVENVTDRTIEITLCKIAEWSVGAFQCGNEIHGL